MSGHLSSGMNLKEESEAKHEERAWDDIPVSSEHKRVTAPLRGEVDVVNEL